jgi:hypothetical protein
MSEYSGFTGIGPVIARHRSDILPVLVLEVGLQVDEFMLVALKQDVTQDVEAQVHNDGEVSVCFKSTQALLKAINAKVLLLDLYQLVDVVLQLVVLQLR